MRINCNYHTNQYHHEAGHISNPKNDKRGLHRKIGAMVGGVALARRAELSGKSHTVDKSVKSGIVNAGLNSLEDMIDSELKSTQKQHNKFSVYDFLFSKKARQVRKKIAKLKQLRQNIRRIASPFFKVYALMTGKTKSQLFGDTVKDFTKIISGKKQVLVKRTIGIIRSGVQRIDLRNQFRKMRAGARITLFRLGRAGKKSMSWTKAIQLFKRERRLANRDIYAEGILTELSLNDQVSKFRSL